MSITGKTIAALLAIFVGLFVGLWLILDRAVQPGFERLEQQIHERDQARVQANLQGQARDIAARSLDYAQWNETYAFIAGRNPHYADDLSPEWLQSYTIDFMGVVDPRGAILWSAAASGSPAAHVETAVRRAIAAAGGATITEPAVGVIWIEGRAVMVSVAPATDSNAEAPARGYVVMGRALSAQNLAEQVQLRVSLVEPQQARGALRPARDVRSWTEGGQLKSLIPLRGPDGHAAGAVLAERERAVSALGRQAIGAALSLFALVAAAAVAALWLLLRRLVIARVVKLDRHLRAQSLGGAELSPLQAPASDDELGRLTGAYNELAARLRLAVQREGEAIRQREAEAAANRLKSDFLANISHELRTPLDAVVGYAELVEEELADLNQASSLADVARILEAARHLIDLVDEIYDLSRIEAGRMALSLSAFDVEGMLREVTAAAERQCAERRNTLRVSLDPALGAAYSDEFRLQQCLANVLAYCSAGAQHGDIHFSAERLEGDALCFTVSGGAALSDDQLQCMFEPFGHAQATAAHRYGGAGLGLAIADKLIAALGGHIEAGNSADRGACFRILVPAIAPDAHTAAASAAEAA